MTAMAAVADRAPVAARPFKALSWLVGFFFAGRFALTFLFFQGNPRLGAVANLGLSVGAFCFSLLAEANGKRKVNLPRLSWPVVRGSALYLLIAGASLIWTQADSKAAAAAYFGGMLLDCLTVLALVSEGDVEEPAEALLQGFVHGCLLLAAVAWVSPAQADSRIGNEEFLHPNGLGLNFALAAILAQHLPERTPLRKTMIAALVLSLLRTISKTSILAFAVTEGLALVFARGRSRAAKLRLLLGAALVLALFSGLFLSYVDNYTSNGDQAETLTGRTAIWAVAADMALETPWLGRGLYSFRAQIPAFDAFQPWHAHDELLQQFFELGAVGVAVTLFYYAGLYRRARCSGSTELRSCGLMLVGFSLLHGLTDTVNFGLSLPLWLMVLLGLRLHDTQARREALC